MRKLILATLTASIGLGIVTGCNAEKKAVTPPLDKTQYTPKKDGEWLNVNDVISFKENITLQFAKFGDWIGASWFRMITMRRSGELYRPADAVYRVNEDKEGVNPRIHYSCAWQDIGLILGTAMDGIMDTNQKTAHLTFRIDGDKHFSELSYQENPRKTKGINPATGEFRDPPKGVPKIYTPKNTSKPENTISPGWRDIYTARTIEISVVDNPKDIKEGVYARWNLPKTLKEMKQSGELDMACKTLIGADYITVGMVEQQVKAEKKAEEQKAKQEKEKKEGDKKDKT